MRKPTPAAAKKPRQFYRVEPWSCRPCKDDRWEICAYVEASGRLEVMAEVLPTSGYTAETLAGFVVSWINDSQTIMNDALTTLELFLQEGRITFTSEQAADTVISRIRKRLGIAAKPKRSQRRSPASAGQKWEDVALGMMQSTKRTKH